MLAWLRNIKIFIDVTLNSPAQIDTFRYYNHVSSPYEPNSSSKLKIEIGRRAYGCIAIAINLTIVFAKIVNFASNNHFPTFSPPWRNPGYSPSLGFFQTKDMQTPSEVVIFTWMIRIVLNRMKNHISYFNFLSYADCIYNLRLHTRCATNQKKIFISGQLL